MEAGDWPSLFLILSLEAAGTRCLAHISSLFLVLSLDAAGTRCLAHISSLFFVLSLEAAGTRCLAHISSLFVVLSLQEPDVWLSLCLTLPPFSSALHLAAQPLLTCSTEVAPVLSSNFTSHRTSSHKSITDMTTELWWGGGSMLTSTSSVLLHLHVHHTQSTTPSVSLA